MDGYSLGSNLRSSKYIFYGLFFFLVDWDFRYLSVLTVLYNAFSIDQSFRVVSCLKADV
jgi:hypothetical protein